MLALVEGGEGVGEVVADHAGAGDSPSCCHFRRRLIRRRYCSEKNSLAGVKFVSLNISYDIVAAGLRTY